MLLFFLLAAVASSQGCSSEGEEASNDGESSTGKGSSSSKGGSSGKGGTAGKGGKGGSAGAGSTGTGGISLGEGGAGGDGPAGSPGGSGAAGTGGAKNPECAGKVTGVIRDFHDSHPDFEKEIGSEKDLVKATLGADGKPVYALPGPSKTITGAASFDQWFRDVPGVNQAVPYTLQFNKINEALYQFKSNAFFPVDGQGFGDEGRDHNFHFTFELHTKFRYKGGEKFSFAGDDDLWVFVEGFRVIDLGGVHGSESASVDIDQIAAPLKLEKGHDYRFDLFFAERHTDESNFLVETSLAFSNCGEPGLVLPPGDEPDINLPPPAPLDGEAAGRRPQGEELARRERVWHREACQPPGFDPGYPGPRRCWLRCCPWALR